MRNIQIISINHRTHDSDDRISLNLEDEKWLELFSFMKLVLNIEGYIHLRTCNRIEIVYESQENFNQLIIEKWISMIGNNSSIDETNFQIFSGYKECIKHLLNLSVGFKSAIFGDDQILSQLKKAFEEARQSDSMSTLLERAYQTIMRFHKQICKETDFKSQTVSLAYQALKSARNRFGTKALKNKNILIIGAGDMATQIVKYCQKFIFESISITNRTFSKAEALVQDTSIQIVAYPDLKIQQYDIIISCTDQGYDLIDNWSQLDYYIDLSLHSSQLNEIVVPHVLLSELQELINKQNMARMESVEKVNSILATKVREYFEWCIAWKERSIVLSTV